MLNESLLVNIVLNPILILIRRLIHCIDDRITKAIKIIPLIPMIIKACSRIFVLKNSQKESLNRQGPNTVIGSSSNALWMPDKKRIIGCVDKNEQ